jgi:hypothetical protein
VFVSPRSLIHLQRGHSLGLGASADSIRRAHYHEAILLNRKKEFSRAAQILSGDAGPGVLADETSFALGASFLRIPRFPEEVAPEQRPLVQRTGEAAVLLAGSKYDLALPKLRDLVRDFLRLPFSTTFTVRRCPRFLFLMKRQRDLQLKRGFRRRANCHLSNWLR